MDRNVRLHDRNIVRRLLHGLNTWNYHKTSIASHSLPSDLRFHHVPPDPYCNALRVGDDLEDGLDHKNRKRKL